MTACPHRDRSITSDPPGPDPGISADASPRCPFRTYTPLHDEHTGAWNEHPDAWVVSRFGDIRDALRDTATWSNSVIGDRNPVTTAAETISADPRFPFDTRRQARRHLEVVAHPLFSDSDPRSHHRQRELVSQVLTPIRMKRFEEDMRGIAVELVDRFRHVGEADVLADFAMPLVTNVTARLLGVPDDVMPAFERWIDVLADDRDGRWTTHDSIVDSFADVDAFYDFFADRITRGRATGADDVLTDLLDASLDGEQALRKSEILQLLVGFLMAGNRVTARLISRAVEFLLDDPDLMAAVRSDPSRIGILTEEVIRLEPPARGTIRVATTDTAIGTRPVAAGEVIVLLNGVANREEVMFPYPDEVELDGLRKPHLAFGLGEHRCLGGNLVRKQVQLAVTTLVERLDGLALAEPAEIVPAREGVAVQGSVSVPVTFAPCVRS